MTYSVRNPQTAIPSSSKYAPYLRNPMHPLRATLPHPWYSGKRGKTPSLHKFTSFTGTKQEILSPGKEQCAELSRQANRNRAPILAVGGLGAKKFLYRANQNLEKQVVKISL